MWLWDWLFLSGGNTNQTKAVLLVNVTIKAPAPSGLTVFVGE